MHFLNNSNPKASTFPDDTILTIHPHPNAAHCAVCEHSVTTQYAALQTASHIWSEHVCRATIHNQRWASRMLPRNLNSSFPAGNKLLKLFAYLLASRDPILTETHIKLVIVHPTPMRPCFPIA